jgi:hypothetical protein
MIHNNRSRLRRGWHPHHNVVTIACVRLLLYLIALVVILKMTHLLITLSVSIVYLLIGDWAHLVVKLRLVHLIKLTSVSIVILLVVNCWLIHLLETTVVPKVLLIILLNHSTWVIVGLLIVHGTLVSIVVILWSSSWTAWSKMLLSRDWTTWVVLHRFLICKSASRAIMFNLFL